MKNIKKYIAGAFLAMSSVLALSSAHAADNGWKKINFHDIAGTREANVVYELYKPFLKANPNVHLQTAVVRLSHDKNQNGSIVVRFVSEGTCTDAGDSCLTNVLWFDARTDNQHWREIWSRHTSTLWVGPVSPTQWGQGMYEIAGNDGLVWRWTGQNTYYPDLRSVATPWAPATQASASLVGYASDVHTDYVAGGQTTILNQTIKLNDVVNAHVLTYQNGKLCGQAGCPFIIVTGSPGTYSTIGEGIIDTLGGTLPANSRMAQSLNGWNSLVVQVAGSGLEFYRYNNGMYRPYMTTYSSDITRTP